MKKLHLVTSVFTAALLASPVMADGDKALTSLEAWDGDSDKMVTQEEWAAAIDEHGLFDKVDKNNNGNFDVEESLDQVLDYDMSMDLDAGGHIDRHEFAIGLFNEQDANDDDRLDESEFDDFASNSESNPLFMTN